MWLCGDLAVQYKGLRDFKVCCTILPLHGFNYHQLAPIIGLSHTVSGFHMGLEFPPPPSHNFLYPEIVKLSMVIILAIYMLLNICVIKVFRNFVPDCVRSI